MRADKSSFERNPQFNWKFLPILGIGLWMVSADLLAAATPAADRSGKEIVDKVCSACHGTGVNGAPKIGDQAAWSKRAAQGLTGLTQNALQGIRQMPAHGGHMELSDLEIGRAVTYMVNQSGGHWVEPASRADVLKERSGEEVVKTQCMRCHRSGKDGAPKIGDQAAWTARMRQGLDYLVHSAIRGHGGMPERGGKANLTDKEIQNAILYMFNPAGRVSESRGTADDTQYKGFGSNHVVAGPFDIYLGVVPAERLRAYPQQSAERTMHGGIPIGPDYYHVNITVANRETHAPVGGATVELQVDRPGVGSESKALEPMMGVGSYGNYVRMKTGALYVITANVRVPGSSSPLQARFDYRLD